MEDRDLSFLPAQGLTGSNYTKQNPSVAGASLRELRKWLGPEPWSINRADQAQWGPVLCLEARLSPLPEQGICALSAEAPQLSVAMLDCFRLTN